MSTFIHKSHNVTVLLYHIVLPAKYRRAVFTVNVDAKLKEICLEISKRYDIVFLEIGTDKNHVHFLVQSVPMYSVKKIVQLVKSITARELFKSCPEVKQQLWGGEFWSDGILHPRAAVLLPDSSSGVENSGATATTPVRSVNTLTNTPSNTMLRTKVSMTSIKRCTNNSCNSSDTPSACCGVVH